MDDDHDTRSDETPDQPESDEGREQYAAVPVAVGERRGDAEDHVSIPETLPLLPIRDNVAFPGTVMPLSVGREKSKRVLDLALAGSRLICVVAQRSAEVEEPALDDLYRIGTACVILKLFKVPDGSETIIVHGLRRVGIESLTQETPYLEARVHAHEDAVPDGTEIEALTHVLRQGALRMVELSENVPDEAGQVIRGIQSPGALADFLAANLPLGLVHKQEILETFDVAARLHKVNAALAGQLDVLELSKKLNEEVRDKIDAAQRQFYLREQMKAIQNELGQKDTQSQAVERLREKLKKAAPPEEVLAEANRELERMAAIPQASPEFNVAMDYVEWIASLPWQVSTGDNDDIARAEQILNEDHYGLDKVKRRILEFLAVRTLKQDTHGPILCFAGPPGVGKTSLGKSIARAMNRKFIRISLGGIRDEATIRGHRRTYIGAIPGRIIQEIRKAGSKNPVYMLDEVDKIGQDVRGDPMSALLEVLDPAQNDKFTDHYLDVPFDLSNVLFIATANYMDAIEDALRDRMEVIEIPGYTHREKLHIARNYLVPRQMEENGLKTGQISFCDAVISLIISDYTREAGVRSLERRIGAVCRSRAAAIVGGKPGAAAVTVDELDDAFPDKRYEPEVASLTAMPGVVTGLAFTAVGGEILFIEVSVMSGSGQVNLTGQIGGVMRESAFAAHSILRNRAKSLGVNPNIFQSTDIHIHVPAGAVPKDGPSAGIAMLAALISAFTGEVVDPKTGMTGEITLSGRVLPIGGVREKVLAGHRAGLRTILLPAPNERDLRDVPADVQGELNFVFVRSIDDVIASLFPRRARKRPVGARKSGRLKAARTSRRRSPAGRGGKKKARRPASGRVT